MDVPDVEGGVEAQGAAGAGGARGGAAFPVTQWSLVLAAGAGASAESHRALSTLCGLYWFPLYAYARRRGYGRDDATDLTQGFFARLLENNIVRGADRDRGKFRSYLLGVFKHYLSHEWTKARAKKRGGGRAPLALDVGDAEARYLLEPATELTAEKLFERQWATTALELALMELAQQSTAAGNGPQFRRLKQFLAGGTGAEYRLAADELGMEEGAVRVAVHRLRTRYRQLLREQITRTVETPEEVDDEIRELFAAVGA